MEATTESTVRTTDHQPHNGQPGAGIGRAIGAPLLMAVMVAVGLGVVDPFGWDRFGPIRWMLLPALGFSAVALGVSTMRWGRSLPNLAWAALLGWGIVASIFAADPLHAWIGTPDRRFGWITWLLCGALFLLARSSTVADRVVVAKGFVIGSLVGAWYSVEWRALWDTDVGLLDSRWGGPFGQPAYLGAAAALALPICGGLAADRTSQLGWRLGAGVATIGNVVLLLGSGSRAAWLGAAVAAVAWAITSVAGGSGGGGAGQRRLAGLGLIAVPVAAIALVSTWRDRITSATGEGGVVEGRIDEWQVGLRALRASPIVGYGPEGYRTVFGQHVDEQYVLDWGRSVITDRAHNGLLDTGLAFGVPGALAYLVLVGLVVFAAVNALADEDPLRIGLAAGVIAYAVQQQFLFPLSEVDPLFWVAAGLMMIDRSNGHISATVESIIRGVLIGLAAVTAVAGALDLVANARLETAIAEDDVASITPWRPDSIRYHFIAARVAGAGQTDGPRALRHLDDGLARSPDDPAFRSERTSVLLEQARSIGEEPARAEALAVALSELEDLAADDPLNPQVLQWLGLAQALSGQLDEAEQTLERTVELAPNAEEPRVNLDEIRRLQTASETSS